jgi:hypothetical protein
VNFEPATWRSRLPGRGVEAEAHAVVTNCETDSPEASTLAWSAATSCPSIDHRSSP